MSCGLTLCRQLRPSSRREHVSASNSHVITKKKKTRESQIVERLIKVYTAQLLSKNRYVSKSLSQYVNTNAGVVSFYTFIS